MAFIISVLFCFVYLLIVYICSYKKIKELKKIYNKYTYLGLLIEGYKVWFNNMKKRKGLVTLIVTTMILLGIFFLGLLNSYEENYVEQIGYVSGRVVSFMIACLLIWLYLISPVQALIVKHFSDEENN